MVYNGASGVLQTRIALPIDFPRAGLSLDPARLRGPGADLALAGAGVEGVTAAAANAAFGLGGAAMLSGGAWITVREAIKHDPSLLRGRATIWVPALFISQASR